jgi:ABC-type lipopolysaccharide export system ATPase subunit
MKFIELTRSDPTGRVLLNTNNIASIYLMKKAVSGGGYADVTVIQETTSVDNYWEVTETIDEVIALLRKQDVQEEDES